MNQERPDWNAIMNYVTLIYKHFELNEQYLANENGEGYNASTSDNNTILGNNANILISSTSSSATPSTSSSRSSSSSPNAIQQQQQSQQTQSTSTSSLLTKDYLK